VEGFGCGFDRVPGFECVFQCEVDPQARRVLEHHYPGVPRTEDVNDERTAAELIRLRPELVAFGSPCQNLSVAGRREGLAGQRSGLFFRCVELCFACAAPLVLWENVPGVFSSSRGNDFASVLEAFTGFRPEVPRSGWRNSGVCVGPLYSIAWACLDAQYRNVPQRRERVFLVGSLGKRSDPYEILSLAESGFGNPPPSRQAKASVASTLETGFGIGRKSGRMSDGSETHQLSRETAATLRSRSAVGSGVNVPGRGGEDDVNLVTAHQCHGTNVGEMGALRRGNGSTTGGVPFVAHSLCSHAAKSGDPTTDNEVVGCLGSSPGGADDNDAEANRLVVAAALNSGGNNGGFRTEPGEHLVADSRPPLYKCPDCGEEFSDAFAAGELALAECSKCGSEQVGMVESDAPTVTHALTKSGHSASEDETGRGTPIVAFQERGRKDGPSLESQEDLAYALTAPNGGGRRQEKQIAGGFGVRRLTPKECARLQSFPDDWLDITPPLADSVKYRLLGNAVCCNVAEWLAQRIAAVVDK
jgi:DNA (cytosine-5)-methyltransferase 1